MFQGFFRDSFGILQIEITWDSPEILWGFFKDISGILLKFSAIPEDSRGFLGILGDSWGFLGFLGVSWGFLSIPSKNLSTQKPPRPIKSLGHSQGFPRIPKDSFVIFLQSPGHSSILSASNIPTFHQISHKIPPPSSLCGFPPVSHRFPTGFPADSQRIPSGFPPVSQKRNSTDSSQL